MIPGLQNNRIGEYELTELIQDGAAGWSFLANQKSLDRQVFLKILKPKIQDRDNWISRFKQEARVCARLKHPNIVEIYSLGEESGYHFLAMEYVDGKSLKSILQHDPKPDLKECFRIMEALLTGLEYVHSHKILHRDIKPGNILLDKYGQVKLTDFGLARIETGSEMTMQGSIVGTPAYMAPEQILSETMDERTDLFSLGLVFFEILCGEKYFNADNYNECLNLVMNYSDNYWEKKKPLVPEPFQLLLAKMLKTDKTRRWKNAGECKAAMPAKNMADVEAVKNFPPVKPAKKRTYIRTLLILTGILLFIYISFHLFTPARFEVSKPLQNQLSNKPENVSDEKILSTPVEVNETLVQDKVQNTPLPLEISQPKPEINLADSALLVLKVSPWGNITLQDKPVAEKSSEFNLKLQAGAITILIENPGFLPIYDTLEISSGDTLRREYSFYKQLGFVWVEVRPWGEIYIDGKYYDTTPITSPLALIAGNHLIEIKNKAFSVFRKQLAVVPGDTTKLNVDLKN